MPRGPRYLPPGWSVEVTTRTTCGFYLLPANPQFARTIVGILAKAQEKYPVKVHAAVASSNHYHLILTPEDLEQLADFMEFFNGNLAREAGRLIGWHGSFWADRYHLIPISPEPDALVDRLRYVLSNTIKENLIERVTDWEGLHCAPALIDGKPMSGTWYDRALEYEVHRQAERKAARNNTPVEPVKRGDFMTPTNSSLRRCPVGGDCHPPRSGSESRKWSLRSRSLPSGCHPHRPPGCHTLAGGSSRAKSLLSALF